MQNGIYSHFGLKKMLIQLLECNTLESNVFKIDINRDGIPIFMSSGTSCWPILGRSATLPNSKPFVIKLFTGTGKPQPLDDYLKYFLSEYSNLSHNGFEFRGRVYKVCVNGFICDAPA